jgi:ESS family glutamate:Na+ symporter
MSAPLPPFALSSVSMRIVSSVGLCMTFMWVGHQIRESLAVTRRVMLPASLIAGLLALLFIQLCGLNDSVISTVRLDWIAGWDQLPGFLINVVFSTLFLGAKVPGLREVWRLAGPQLAYGQVLAWGNWLVASLVTIVLLQPVWGVPAIFSTLLEVGFEGGHGTAAGLREVYEQLGYAEGGDLAVTCATIGIICGVLFGTLMVNIGQSRGWSYSSYKASTVQVTVEDGLGDSSSDPAQQDSSRVFAAEHKSGAEGAPQLRAPARRAAKTWRDRAVIDVEERPVGMRLTISNDALDTLALHAGFIGVTILLAYFTKRALMAIENTSEELMELKVLSGFPLFPICMLWGGVVQMFIDRFAAVSPIERDAMERICGVSLDFLVFTAIATTRIEAVATGIVPLLVLILFGLVWQFVCLLVVAPIMLPDFWFERGLCEMGKGMGTTATGLLLLRMVDPKGETPVLKAFSCKQLLHEPFMGGGLWTSLSLPIAVTLGNWVLFGISAGFIVFWIVIWFLLFKRLKPAGPLLQHKFRGDSAYAGTDMPPLSLMP